MDKSKHMHRLYTGILYALAVVGLLFLLVHLAMRLGLTDDSGIIDNQQESFLSMGIDKNDVKGERLKEKGDQEDWNTGKEWEIFLSALKKDENPIKKAALEAKISPRLIASILAIEQLRLFHTERAIFEQIFAPLKIFGTQSQFSWGVMGIKQETAIEIENNLKNPSSPHYPGPAFKDILDFEINSTEDKDSRRYHRLTNEDDRYYSYLYSALYIRQILSEWEKAGFPIEDKPGVIATLFNIGFQNSIPKENPELGGSSIEIHGNTYSFGGLAEEIYYSNEFRDIFYE